VIIFGQGHYPFLKVCIPIYMALHQELNRSNKLNASHFLMQKFQMPSRVHDIKLILIFFGLSCNYDNFLKYGLDNKVAQCLSPIVYGVESSPLLF
jgi:hypothetical protein